ncbi:MAG: hypothetical protein RMI45_03585, partial [Ignisphaera sp.]|nr:hypothetical protein [Ignisphaera sp.]MDW8085309.1 hypothetical protein [Ignisphaera sp.]
IKPFEGIIKSVSDTSIEIIGEDPVDWRETSHGVEIEIPKYLCPTPAYVIKMEPLPRLEK